MPLLQNKKKMKSFYVLKELVLCSVRGKIVKKITRCKWEKHILSKVNLTFVINLRLFKKIMLPNLNYLTFNFSK